MPSITILYDKVRFEEKELFLKGQRKNIDINMVDAKSLYFNNLSATNSNTHNLHNLVIQRCVSHFRGLYITKCLEFHKYLVINNFNVGQICGNKLLTSIALSSYNVPTPETFFSFSSESAFECIDRVHLPTVIKPIVGSWGRGVFSIKDKDMAKVIIEMREDGTSPFSNIYYLQEYIHRPPRDLRCIVIGERLVTAVYRYSSPTEWRTNVSRGGKTESAEITNELEDIAIRASRCVGGGILGIDIMEDKERGFLVHEINNTVEFRGASSVSNYDIASAILDYMISVKK